jgi:glutamyl-tRNA reductase
MNIFVIGLNFRTASIEELERCVISSEDLESSLSSLKGEALLNEIVILSTCNRVEVYGVTEEIHKAIAAIESFFISKSGIPSKRLLGMFFIFEGHKAIEHLFKVASSIDSMVIGEPQIQGQVREAYDVSRSLDGTGKILNRLFQTATTLGKKIRTETDIGKKSVSIASVGVKLASEHFLDLSTQTVFLIGAGEMAENTAFLLVERQIKSMYIFNRSESKADALAERFNANTVPDIRQGLIQSDIVISSTSSKTYIINKEQIVDVMSVRKNNPMMLIDITIPRDIDPEVGSVENVQVYNIDDLRMIAEEHKREREKDIEVALVFVREEVESFLSWLSMLSLGPVIKNLNSRVESLCKNEIVKNFNRLMTAESKEEAAQALARSITKKILHDPISVLKDNVMTENGRFVNTVRGLFKLKEF